jgi:nucleotide-binding universal stress UspA family protein
MITRVLLGYDGSDSAKHAFEFAVDLVRRYEAELHVLAVARPPDFAEDVETEAIIENSTRHYREVLEPIKAQLAAEAIPGRCEVAVGHPAEQLVLYAERHGVEHIVVGHRGHTLFERWLIGSVARQVIAHAPCAVTVVRK